VGSIVSKVTPERASARKTIAQALFGVVGIVFGGAFTGVFYVVDKRQPGVSFWVLMGVSAFLLLYSFYAGARGIEKINQEHGYFNRQAIATLFGFLALAASLRFLGPEKADQQSQQIAQLLQEIGGIKGDLARLEEDDTIARKNYSDQVEQLRQLQSQVDALSRATTPTPNRKVAPRHPSKYRRD